MPNTATTTKRETTEAGIDSLTPISMIRGDIEAMLGRAAALESLIYDLVKTEAAPAETSVFALRTAAEDNLNAVSELHRNLYGDKPGEA